MVTLNYFVNSVEVWSYTHLGMSCDLIKILVINHKRLWYISINFFLNTDDVILNLYTSLCQKAKCTLSAWSTVIAMYRRKWLLCCTIYASLTGMTDSVTISPVTWGRIFLVKFEMKEYSEGSCYFVVKLSLIFGNSSTKTAVKHQALVNSNFKRTNHVHWTTKKKRSGRHKYQFPNCTA